MGHIGRFFSILLICLAFSPAARAGVLVEDVRYGGDASRMRIVIDLDRPVKFRAFLLDKPNRIVLDLPDAAFKTFKSRLNPSNPLVSAYRSGKINGGITRVIFDLRKPATIRQAFAIPKGDPGGKDRLVLDLSPASVNAFAAQKSRVFGTRELGDLNAAPPADDEAAVPASSAAPSPAAKPAPRPQAAKTPLEKRTYTIVVDAGHGGDDPGAEVPGYREKDITFALALELRRQLEETGLYRVVLTRDKDYYIKLRERLALSRKEKADLFVSIHADKSERGGVHGASVYTLSETASDDETARLAESENNAGFVAGVDLGQESQDVADILLDLAMRDKMNESNMFARQLTHAFLRNNVQLLPNSHRSAGFAVLKAPDVPSVLIESGFLSNKEDAKLLSSSDFQRKFAAAVLDGINAYFRKMRALQTP